MLSIVHGAQTQFRHESALREREWAVLAAIREREAHLASRRSAWAPAARRETSWPRPIGLATPVGAVCVTA
ncbi:hypothetical protein [Microbacterium sp. BK668]|uniref:hypothetical protein n=1 Tax=Microbacterium sp. BK668 TaxID=2512118 RepID=UPI00105FA70B|nr:hypothetical protein [Microbacterium sp. BK668]TDN91812.1 hypothetical protein EV279_1317 [Microbacterium sp. BK668]